MAPVVRDLRRPGSGLEPVVVSTGQHRHLLDQVLKVLEIDVDIDLDLMVENQELAEFSSKAISGLSRVVADEEPSLVLVHGDTSTALAGALAGFYNRVPVGHVEAGLRTGDLYSPWPEEANRRLVGGLAAEHFAPTEASRQNLLREGIPTESILVTGNTVVDSLHWIRDELLARPSVERSLAARFDHLPDRDIVLVTNHRRENFGDGMKRVYSALRELAGMYPELAFVFPVHLNPNARRPAEALLGGMANVHLIEPVEYLEFVYLMTRARLIVTDSGGVQEEAPSLSVPVLVTRETTERPEAIAAGTATLVGTDPDLLIEHAHRLLRRAPGAVGPAGGNPYGDGRAASRIGEVVRMRLGLGGSNA